MQGNSKFWRILLKNLRGDCLHKKLSPEEIIKIYNDAAKLPVWKRIIFFVISLVLSFWFLTPVIFKDDAPPIWLVTSLFITVTLWVAIVLPNHLQILGEDERLKPVRFNPILATKCGLGAIKPGQELKEKHPWLQILFYLAVILPVISVLISLLFLFYNL